MRHIERMIFCLTAGLTANLEAADFSGFIGLESRFYTDSDELQHALLLEPELYLENDPFSDSLTIKLFHRQDEVDEARSHSDLREFMWLHSKNNWELHLGVGKVFWGVTESAHLVDIINQTDNLEGFDGEEKLGQPMLHWSGLYDWGIVDAFVLPYFREREFTSLVGGLPSSPEIDTDSPRYESGGEEKHTDLALRYSRSLGQWDFGLSYFTATNRDPYLLPIDVNVVGEEEVEGSSFVFRPYYTQITQFGLDLQATIGAYLWKLEAIQREDSMDSYTAFVFGLEYTIVGVWDSQMDLGLLIEKHHDGRGQEATTPLQDDLFLGARFAFNDMQDTSVLVGVIQDLEDSKSYSGVIEASRRVGGSFRVTLDALLIQSQNPIDPLFMVNKDDQINFHLEYYY